MTVIEVLDRENEVLKARAEKAEENFQDRLDNVENLLKFTDKVVQTDGEIKIDDTIKHLEDENQSWKLKVMRTEA